MFISNENLNSIIKIIKSLEHSSVFIDGTTETVKHEIEKTRRLISCGCVSTFGYFISATSDINITKYFNYKPIFNWGFFLEIIYLE